MRLFCVCALAGLIGGLLGCGNSTAPVETTPHTAPQSSKPDDPTPAAKGGDTPPSKASDPWGTVKGRVTWGGDKPPKSEKIDTSKDPGCAKCDVTNEEIVVGKNGGVKNVIVWLLSSQGDLPIHPSLKEIKDKEVVMDQPCCKFEPRVVAMRQGQTLIGKNTSPIGHNMNWVGGDNAGNLAVPPGGSITIKLVAAAKPVAIQCNTHGWMHAYVGVFNHPYFAVTDDDGKFEIKNAPAGKFNIIMWQEGVGWVNGGKTGRPIDIPAGGTAEVNEKMKPPE